MQLLGNLYEYSKTNRIAICDGSREMSFRELWHKSEAIARWLIVNYPGHGVVAIFGDKECNMICSIVASIKSGHPYVCIPSYYPNGKINAIIDDCRPDVILNISENNIYETEFTSVQNSELELIASSYDSSVNIEDCYYTQSDEELCILYTSGSSGTPKGVLLTCRNMESKVNNVINCFDDIMPAGNGRALNLTSFSFSASFTDVFYFLFQEGCTLYCISHSIISDYLCLPDIILNVNPHMMICTPTLADRLMSSGKLNEAVLNNLRFVLLGGEPLSAGIGRKIRNSFPNIIILNGYGTTETTATPLACRLTPDIINGNEAYMPIGYRSESTVYLADDNGNIIQSDNESGELIVYGDAVSPGYLHLPSQTEEAFFEDSCGRRAFRTGDIMCYRNGYIYCLGRKDNQVKLGGNRFELEDVEAHIKQIDNVKDCAAALFTLSDGSKNLMSYVVRVDDTVPKMKSVMEIKKKLKGEVESYMIPTKIVFVDSLPKNDNLKLDRICINKMAEKTK